MDYCLGPGDGTAAMFSGRPDFDLDGNGEFDSVRIDFDGDGVFDDALADLDGDGLADHAALDLDDDGTAESLYTDDGSGTWAMTSIGPVGPLRWFSLDGAEHTGEGPADVDGDGSPDRLFDVDRDGVADRALRTTDGTAGVGWVDTDGDGRWDVKLIDTDGDGSADDATALD
ncbi:pullulanase [Candidatus Mycolicibacterium alkanivorans]|uniref:Pullulanase n=1 Tax=Candidatus Mycolicibacterium alkanivorans TaxID=2954114 RepID=A0ABS9YS43_9MYCO|nr:pullulanase [Candidatus Mycolicibacterium alkanivorans]MCI4674030.1 pullulanase [Candidatus Mycolicibacterium alkanivorans]